MVENSLNKQTYGTSVINRCVRHGWSSLNSIYTHCPKCFQNSNPHLFKVEENKMSTVNNIQHGGTHYKEKTVQPWDYIAANNLGYFEGNVVKYVSRWRDKGGVEDLRKARHYLDKLIELETRDARETN